MNVETNITKEKFKQLVLENGLLKKKIETYWNLQALKKSYEQMTYLSNQQKQQITNKIEELSALLCDEILGDL